MCRRFVMMADIITRSDLLLFLLSAVVPSSVLQPAPPLSLPVHMSVVPPPWKFLPLSQADFGSLFSNSSPFSSSQSVLMRPPPSRTPQASLQASFGPYVVTQRLSEPSFSSPPLSASLLSNNIERERDQGGQERLWVRVLFHTPGHSSTQGSCVTLHAFKETQERRASCIPQLPLGLCVASLTVPEDWMQKRRSSQPRRDAWSGNTHSGWRMQKWGRHRLGNLQRATSSTRNHVDTLIEVPQSLRFQHGSHENQIQLYYSSISTNLELTAGGCAQDGTAQSQNKLFFIKAVSLKEHRESGSTSQKQESCLNREEGVELDVDSHVVIRYHKGPAVTGEPIKVSVSLRANFSAQLVVVRLRVKKGLVSMVAQRTPTSDLWAVNLERSQASKHDVVSIFCHKRRLRPAVLDPTALQQVVCLSIDGLRQSFGVAMMVSADWWVEYSGHKNLPPPHGASVSIFYFADRHIFGIAPITESNTIINTAILTNQPVSLPVIVLGVSHDNKVSDVTSAVTCHSTNEDTIKVSRDCSSIFVDGSESGLGDTCAVVEFQLGTFHGSLCVSVWAPLIPLRVSLSDPVLNAINGWVVFTNDGCVPVYQRSSVQVLTQFTARDSLSRTSHLLGSADWLVDVTELVHNWLRVQDPGVAFLSQNTLVGLRPGRTSINVVSEQWDGILGQCDVTVSPEVVTLGDLGVQVVGGLGMSVKTNPAHPAIVTATVITYNIMYYYYQEAAISVWLQFDDNTSSLLSTFSDLPFSLQLSSLAETVVVVTSSPGQRVLARGDGGGPLVQAELLISACTNQPILSNSISDDDSEWRDSTGGGGGTRRLARGSGWVRVNLDLGLLQRMDEELEYHISDMLVESDSNVYTSTQDHSGTLSTSDDHDGKLSSRSTNQERKEARNEGMVSRNGLERAVLIPSLQAGTLYFSPNQKGADDRGQDLSTRQGAQELDVGTGTVLSLLCLTAVLFLVNCLPCALGDKMKKRRMESERESQPEGTIGGEQEDEQDSDEVSDQRVREMENIHLQDEQKLQHNTDEDVKEVEIIC